MPQGCEGRAVAAAALAGGAAGWEEAAAALLLEESPTDDILVCRSPEAAAAESRSWQFMLLRPSPLHVAALCVERAEGADSTDRGLVLSAFEGLPLAEHSPMQVQVLGQGCCF